MDPVEARLQRRNNGFGPISAKRGHLVWYAALVCTVIAVCTALTVRYFVYGIKAKELFTTGELVTICGIVSSLLSADIFRRFLLFIEERKHINSRYMGNSLKALEACFHFKYVQGILLIYIITTIVVLVFHSHSNFTLPLYILILMCHVGIYEVFHVKHLSPAEVSRLGESDDKNIASGLAWSYYYGYLNLVLPGFKDMIKEAVAPDFTHDGRDLRDCILPANRKMFIVIPRDCYCYRSFTDIDPRITFINSMPAQRITRGGVQNRVYKNSLYCISVEGKKPVYALLEYATPLLTMYDMSRMSGAKFTQRDLEHQTVQFVRTLKQILSDDPKVSNSVYLVLVGKSHENLADVLVSAMEDQRVDFE